MDLKNISKIHFIGVGGIYVSALALLMRNFDKEVSGCDANDSEILTRLEKEGIDIFKKHDVSHIENDLDLVVHSAAVPEDHVELEEARKMAIKRMTVYELLGEVSRDMNAIVVSGTKGKTTTTALLGLILTAAEFDPTVVVGGKVKDFFYGNLRVGNSEFLVAEGCEFQAQMLKLHPNLTVITNIEADHLDYYKDLDHIVDTFVKYVALLPRDGYVVINNDEANCMKLCCNCSSKIITYGIEQESDIMAKNIKTEAGKQSFDLYVDGREVENITLQVPGRFNIYNALGASAAAIQLGVGFKIIKQALEKFQGSWRRFEKVGEYKGAPIISDYAHTPISVKSVIEAAKEFYPDKRVIAVFQPHLHSRTKKLFNEFVKAFKDSDLSIISDIYFVKGRVKDEDKDVSSEQLVKTIRRDALHASLSAKALYGGDLQQTKKLILENVRKDDVVLLIGAGDIYKLGEKLIQKED